MINYFKDLVARYNFWRASKIKFEKDYKFYLDFSNPKSFTVELVSLYPKVVVEYSNLDIGDNGYLNFDIAVISNPLNLDTSSKKFSKFTSRVMMSIIGNAIKSAKVSDETGKTDPVEFVEERDIFEESDPVLEERVPERKPRKKSAGRNKAVRK
jgi:hypothetical protein